MTSLDLAFIFFLLLTFLNYRARSSVLYPPFIFCVMWLLPLAVIRSGLIEIYPVHGNTLAIVAAGATAFSAGGLLACFAPRKLLGIHRLPSKPKRTPDFIRSTLMVVLVCGLPIMFYHTWQLSKSQGGGFNILAQARLEIVEEVQNEKPSQSVMLAASFTSVAIFASLLFC